MHDANSIEVKCAPNVLSVASHTVKPSKSKPETTFQSLSPTLNPHNSKPKALTPQNPKPHGNPPSNHHSNPF